MYIVQIFLLVVTFTSQISQVLTLKSFTKEFKPHACTYHVVIIVIINITIVENNEKKNRSHETNSILQAPKFLKF